MQLLRSFPVLLVDDELGDDTAAGRSTRALVDHLLADGTQVITATDLDDAAQIVASTPQLSAFLIDWDAHHTADGAIHDRGVLTVAKWRTETLIKHARERNRDLPILILADRSSVEDVPMDVLRMSNGYVWKLEDTPAFIAARVEELQREYLEPLLPPFFGALVRFTEEARYSWHTPGHSGGTAFLKTPVGAAFHAFFGENTLRSDLSVSVGELGSLLEHTGPVGEAEREAARTFGADRTMFVTNGTSAANKIVFHSCVGPGDVVLVDRNCHKSVMHAIVMTGAIPVYLHPIRNQLGVIGPIPPTELDPERVRRSFMENPLVPAGTERARLAVLTNSTYDGLCYDAGKVLDSLEQVADRVLFDEAWFAYAHFHPLYADRHAMGTRPRPFGPAIFATQSTHKLLTAFSQGSMVHLHDHQGIVSEAALEEAFMMHTSTSPQYGIIASLDVSARTMDGPQGTALIDDAVDEAVRFRRELAQIATSQPLDDWSFGVWQPEAVADGTNQDVRDPELWMLRDDQTWHGYHKPGDRQVMLDPIKVTITTPGLAPHGLAEEGIPAAIVSRFLDERGIVVEKTGSYSLLVLFSLGVTKGKAGTLLAELLEFKRLHDGGAALREVMPRLVAEHPERYGEMTLADLCRELHGAMREVSLPELIDATYEERPEPAVTPTVAFQRLVAGEVDMVGVEDLAGRVSAAMVVPYPPGIPVIMPGEQYGSADSGLVRYLRASEQLATRVPGFETEIHGIQANKDQGYRLAVLRVTDAL
jgi:arginine decarboxylase